MADRVAKPCTQLATDPAMHAPEQASQKLTRSDSFSLSVHVVSVETESRFVLVRSGGLWSGVNASGIESPMFAPHADYTKAPSVFTISQLIEGPRSGSTKWAYTEGARREGKEFGGWRREIGAQPAVS
jgi:hypothetical protein